MNVRIPCATFALISSLPLVLVLLIAFPTSASGQVDGLDHFNCYQASGDLVGEIVRLQDQFDVLDRQVDTALVWRPFQFCNPVEKVTEDGTVTPIIHETNHLLFYRVLDFPSGRARQVVVGNQFGEQRLNVSGRASLLAVPTEKEREGMPEDLDHFKCYQVRGDPLDVDVKLFDQFFPDGLETQVLEPKLLCNPVHKTHGGEDTPIENAEAHLTCFSTTPTAFERDVRVENQFQKSGIVRGKVRVRDSQRLCVPSKKRIAEEQRADLVIDLPTPARVSCPGGGGTCTQEMDYEVTELAGVPVIGNFTVQMNNELGQSASIVIPGLGAGASSAGTLTLGPPGDNCYNPDCTTDAVVDPPVPGGGVIPEADESNNTDSRTDQG